MALSDVTLTAGMRQNLLSLQSTASLLDRTASRLSTGLNVSSALDDPVKFFAAAGHTQRATDLTARKSEMGEAIQTLKAADSGNKALTALIASAKSIAQASLSADTTTEQTSLMAQYTAITLQIDDLAADSGYKGVNLLGGTGQTLEVKFDETGTSSVTLTGYDGSSSGLSLVAASGWNSGDGTADITAVNADITLLDNARTTIRSESTTLSNHLSTITIREDFTNSMINTLLDGAANLTNADLNQEGANMLMLQTRQALGTNSLALASQAAQSVLRLF